MKEITKALEGQTITGTVIDIGGSSRKVNKNPFIWIDCKADKYIILDNDIEKEVKKDLWIEKDYFFDLNKSDVMEELKEIADWVFVVAVFNYVWNPVKAFDSIYKMLKKGGKAVITFPLIMPHCNINEADSCRYTTSGVINLIKHTEFSDFKLIGYKTENKELLHEFYRKEKMHKLGDWEVISFVALITK